MKFLTKLTVLTLFSASSVAAQNAHFDVRLALKNVDCTAGKVNVGIEVKAHDAAQAFKMGDANYRFAYNPKQIHAPKLSSQDNFSSQAPQADRNYGSQNLQGSREIADAGIVSLNTFFTGAANNARLVNNS